MLAFSQLDCELAVPFSIWPGGALPLVLVGLLPVIGLIRRSARQAGQID